MEYKTVEHEGVSFICVDDKGLPIVVDDDGKEQAVDAIHLLSKIPSLQEESKNHRLRAKEIREEFDSFKESFAGIEDPAKAREALDKIKDIENQKLIDAGEAEALRKQLQAAADKVLSETKTSYENKIVDLQKIIAQQDNDIFDAKVTSRFDNSSWFSGAEPKTILPPSVAKDHFGKYFKVEKSGSGQSVVVGYINDEKIFSIERPGEVAGFDEAIGIILDRHPQKEQIVRSPFGGGAGGGDTPTSKSTLDKLLKAYREASDKRDATNMVLLERQIAEERRKSKG